jgi:hypothetical protein
MVRYGQRMQPSSAPDLISGASLRGVSIVLSVSAGTPAELQIPASRGGMLLLADAGLSGERGGGSEFCLTRKMLRCPACHDGSGLRRSRPRWHDFPYRLVGMKAYRCLMCDARFYAWKHPSAMRVKQAPGTE